MQKKYKTLLEFGVLGVGSVVVGIMKYRSGWDALYNQPASEIGAIGLISFGLILIVYSIYNYIK